MRHPRAGDEPADEAAGREERQRNAAELGAAVTLGEGGEADLGPAEAEAEARRQADDGHDAARLERAEDRRMPLLVRPPGAHGLGERDQRRADAADHGRDAEREHR